MERRKAEKASRYLKEAQARLGDTLSELSRRNTEMTPPDRLRDMFIKARVTQLRIQSVELLSIAGSKSSADSLNDMLETLLVTKEWLHGFEVGAGDDLPTHEARTAIYDAIRTLCE